jgi:hypothetical protein
MFLPLILLTKKYTLRICLLRPKNTLKTCAMLLMLHHYKLAVYSHLIIGNQVSIADYQRISCT